MSVHADVLIYLLFDENGPRYVGKTVHLGNRLYGHKEKFTWLVSWTVIEVVPAEEDWEVRERFWISYYRQWYKLENISPGGLTGHGWTLSEETKQRMSQAKVGKKRTFTEEHRKNIRTAHRGQKPHPWTAESRRRLSTSIKGVPKKKRR